MHHLNQMFNNLVHPTWVCRCGFVLRLTGAVPPEVEAQLAEFAEMAGRLVTTLVGLRLKRGLFYQCRWPHAMTAVLNETIPDMFDETMKRFERDLQNLEELEALEAHTDEQEKVMKRSQFKMRAVKQYKHAVNEKVNGKYTEETEENQEVCQRQNC